MVQEGFLDVDNNVRQLHKREKEDFFIKHEVENALNEVLSSRCVSFPLRTAPPCLPFP